MVADPINFFKGTYDHNNKLFFWKDEKTGEIFRNGAPAVTSPTTAEIYYNDFAFNLGYDRLAYYADHELSHRSNLLSGRYKNTKNIVLTFEEEWRCYYRNFQREGLYPHTGIDMTKNLGHYGQLCGIYNSNFEAKWWQIIYKIPRKF